VNRTGFAGDSNLRGSIRVHSALVAVGGGIEPSVESVGDSCDALAESINCLYKAEVTMEKSFETVEFATLE
jgi:hypothetical protein